MRTLVLMVTLSFATQLSAQPVVKHPLLPAAPRDSAKSVDSLELAKRELASGRWSEAASLFRGLLTKIPLPKGKGVSDIKRRAPLLVTIETTSRSTGKPMLASFLLPAEGALRPVPSRVAGVRWLYHLFLSPNPSATLSAEWKFDRTQNPDLDLLAAFAKTTISSIGEFATAVDKANRPDTAGQVVASSTGTTKPTGLGVYATLDSVVLPGPRGTVSSALRAVTTAVKRDDVLQAVSSAGEVHAWSEWKGKPCVASVDSLLSQSAKSAIDTTFWIHSSRINAMRKKVQVAFHTALTSSACTSPTAAQERSAVQPIVAAYLSALSVAPVSTEGAVVVNNIPNDWVDIGTVVGVFLGPPEGVNLEVVNGKFAGKRFTGLVSAAVVHVHRPIDPTDANWARSHVRNPSLFAGVVATPREGLTAGVSLPLWQSLGLQVSRVWLRSNQFNKGAGKTYAIGDSVPATGPAFRSGVTRYWTAGFTFKIQ